LRREHIVAASLVGSVVVVIGFASGLGTRPGPDANAAPAHAGPEPEQPAATAPVTTTQTPGGTHYPSGGGGPVPVATGPAVPPGTHYTGPQAPPPTSTTVPTTTTPPTGTTPSCEAGFVPEAVSTLLGTLDRAGEALGLGLVAPTAAVPTAAIPAPALPDGTPLDQFLATCPAPPTTTTTPTGPAR